MADEAEVQPGAEARKVIAQKDQRIAELEGKLGDLESKLGTFSLRDDIERHFADKPNAAALAKAAVDNVTVRGADSDSLPEALTKWYESHAGFFGGGAEPPVTEPDADPTPQPQPEPAAAGATVGSQSKTRAEIIAEHGGNFAAALPKLREAAAAGTLRRVYQPPAEMEATF